MCQNTRTAHSVKERMKSTHQTRTDRHDAKETAARRLQRNAGGGGNWGGGGEGKI
jgi:hypothetical protein